jgi:hypothetical protein
VSLSGQLTMIFSNQKKKITSQENLLTDLLLHRNNIIITKMAAK